RTWPPLLLTGLEATPVAGPGIDADDLTVVSRPDGGHQVAHYGRPLYHYAGDTAPGDTNGDGVGGRWHAAKPEVAARPTGTETSAAPAPPANEATTPPTEAPPTEAPTTTYPPTTAAATTTPSSSVPPTTQAPTTEPPTTTTTTRPPSTTSSTS